jgi:hypothetical protein
MPPSDADKVPGLRAQRGHARSDLVLHLAHKGVPWALFIALTVAGNVLRLVSSHFPAVGQWLWLTAGLAAAGGAGLAAWEWHLRGHHQTRAGRLIGPVTTTAATVMLTAFLLAGYRVPLVLAWLLGGTAGCIGWDLWLAHADRHDPARAFAVAAERAGLGQLRLSPAARKGAAPALPPRPAAAPARAARGPLAARLRPAREPAVPGPVRGTIRFPPGDVPDDQRAARVESANELPPGSMVLSPNPDNTAAADYAYSDPRTLDTPVPWPGPSAPGADMAVPFRYGLFQTGETVLVPRLPLFHTRGMGQTGSAKTTGWSWNQLGEGVTRQDYAAVVMDVSKGEQFFGCWRPALHRFETDEEKALYLLRGLHRARRARTDYLGRKRLINWEPGCGLSFLDIFMAEAPDLIRLLETARSRMASAVMSLEDWSSDVKNGRSAGMAWNLDLQLTLATEMPSVAQGQMAHLCLGVEDAKQAAFGLSARQRVAGNRPELWGKKYPGKAYWDAPTLDGEYGTTALRFWHWEGEARQAFAYAEQWEAAGRPLDDVTGEALEAEPAPPASHALPGPAGTLPGSRPAAPALPPRPAVGRPPKDRTNVTPLFRPAGPSRSEQAETAEEVVRRHLAEMYLAGRTLFAFDDLTKDRLWASLGEPPGGKANRSRSWGYSALSSMVTLGYLEEARGSRRRWRILPAVLGDQAAQGEEQ